MEELIREVYENEEYRVELLNLVYDDLIRTYGAPWIVAYEGGAVDVERFSTKADALRWLAKHGYKMAIQDN